MKLNNTIISGIFHMTKVMIGKTSDIAEGKVARIAAGSKEILIANVGGQYYATDNICNHSGVQLHEGELNGKELICP
jgi:nitrite reductase/ring-hydroxylating ferredoxin subunit